MIARLWAAPPPLCAGVGEQRASVSIVAPLAEKLALATIDATAALVLVCDGEGRILLANPALQRFAGQSSGELVGRFLWDVLVIPEEVGLAQSAVTEAFRGTPRLPTEVTWLAAHGVRRQVELQSSVLAERGKVYATAFIGIDVTEQRAREAHLHVRATTDALTGLTNRGALFELLHDLLDPQKGVPCGLLFLDLDDFKAVNDEYGHSVGDRLLVETAARLVELAAPDDIVARLGGDEFVIVRPGADLAGVGALRGAIEERMRDPFDKPVPGLRIAASVGAALGTPGEAVDDLISHADSQMYDAKIRRYRSRQR